MFRLYSNMLLAIVLFANAVTSYGLAQQTAPGGTTNLIHSYNIPTNAQLPTIAIMATDNSGRIVMNANIIPSTQNTGAGVSAVNLASTNATLGGELEFVRFDGGSTPSHDAPALASTIIRFLNCDPASGNTNLTQRFLDATDDQPLAVLLYSLSASGCMFLGAENNLFFQRVYSMVSATEAKMFEQNLGTNLKASIYYNSSVTVNGQPSLTSSSPAQTSSVLGPAPSTAVAMIILYSITGLITFLFITVITGGAIRAHRHPERYGPRRGGGSGRPRQSRAKGIARAVLETLPIVKFKQEDEAAGKTPEDLEMQRSAAASAADTTHPTSETPGEATETHAAGEKTDTAIARTTDDALPTTSTPVVPSSEEITEAPLPIISEDTKAKATMHPSQLECPICIQNFEPGEDLRVLPCHHSFHPECVDPWLLNVSGSCPLCRIDLHPEASTASPAATESAVEATPTAAATPVQQSRFARYRDVIRLSSISPEERIHALEQLREDALAASNRRSHRASSSMGEGSRLSRILHGRRRTLDAGAGAAPPVVAAPGPTAADAAVEPRPST